MTLRHFCPEEPQAAVERRIDQTERDQTATPPQLASQILSQVGVCTGHNELTAVTESYSTNVWKIRIVIDESLFRVVGCRGKFKMWKKLTALGI